VARANIPGILGLIAIPLLALGLLAAVILLGRRL